MSIYLPIIDAGAAIFEMNDVPTECLEVAGQSLDVLRLPGATHEAQTLVMLHEGLGSIGLWHDLPRRLRDLTGHSVLAFSRHGNGFSSVLERPRNARYLHDEALTVLPALLDWAQVERPLILGHSDGASIALIFAGAHPQRAAGLVLLAPHVFVEACSLRSITEIAERYRAGPLRERMARHHRDVDRTFFGWNDIWLDPTFADWNIEEYLPSIVAPVIMVQGRDDEYGTMAQLDAIARGLRVRADRIELDDCGHSPQRDRPGAIESIVAAFAQAGWK
ncbi:MAG TPA: alpha/beta hydrolase [Candidatus Acidoferrum sp.]|nr:alpha/beta hydrolase [Candidatus Acidoferrum sp.]